MELGEFTTDQLLEELLSRPTFAGFVVRSKDEVRQIMNHRHWCLLVSPNLTLEQVQIVLKTMLEKVETTR